MQTNTPTVTPRLSVIVLARSTVGLETSIRSARQITDRVWIACGNPQCLSRVKELAARTEVTVVDSQWSDSLAHLRNDAMRQAKGDWILWLLEGETLTPESVDGIRQRLQGGQLDSGCVYYLAIQSTDPASGTVEQRAEPRLLPNRPGLRYAGRIAENISKAVVALELDVDGLPERIDTSQDCPAGISEATARQGLYLCEREVQQLGPCARTLNFCAECWEALGEISEAQAAYRQAAGLAEKGSTEQLRAYHGLIGLAEGDPQQQLELCRRASEQFPVDMPILCVMAMALQHLGEAELALRCYATAYRYGLINPELWHTDQLRDYAARCYALMLRLAKRSDEAMNVLEEAYNDGLQSPALARQLLELYVNQGQLESSLALFDTMTIDKAQRAPLRSAVRGAALAAQKNWIAARAQLEAAYRADCRDTLCFRGLATCYLALGMNREAEDVALHWISVEPDSAEAKLFVQAAQKPNQAIPEPRTLRFDIQSDERVTRQESSDVTAPGQ